MNTLRSGLIDLINEINALIRASTDANERKELLKLLTLLDALLDQVVRDAINANTQKYATALTRLKEANKDVKAAIKDLEKTAGALKKIASAAKAVDKVVKLISSVL